MSTPITFPTLTQASFQAPPSAALLGGGAPQPVPARHSRPQRQGMIQRARFIQNTSSESRSHRRPHPSICAAVRSAQKSRRARYSPSSAGNQSLRMVAGLEEISGGELYIDGKLMNDVEPKNRDIAMVFQSYALYPHMTVYENMAFPLKLRKVPKDEIDRRVRAAATLDITHFLDRKPKAMSGGQRQRVAIGRAIVREPKVLLMDEPLSNLDAKLRNQMRAEIIKLRQKINTTFIYVTHDQTEAMTLGDRIVIMKDGFVQQVGTPQEVFDHPANSFVAGFIGMPQMNFFDARLEREGNRYFAAAGGCRVELSPEKEAALSAKGVPAQDVTLGVRPSHMILADRPENTLTATVDVSEMMGSEVHFHASALGRDVVVVVPTTDLNGAHLKGFSVGDTLHLTFNGSVCHVFDRDGKNLEF